MLAFFDSGSSGVPPIQTRAPFAKLFRRELLGSLRFDEEISHGEDALFNSRFLAKCSKILQTCDEWYLYRSYEGSASRSLRLEQRTRGLERIRTMDMETRYENARRVFEYHLLLEAATILLADQGVSGFSKAHRFLKKQVPLSCFSKRFDFDEFHMGPRSKLAFALCCAGRCGSALIAYKVLFGRFSTHAVVLAKRFLGRTSSG